MTLQNMIELIQLHHPDVPSGLLRTLVNLKRRELSDRSNLLNGYVDFTTSADTIYYAMPDRCVEVIRAEYDGKAISRQIPIPATGGDSTFLTPLAGE